MKNTHSNVYLNLNGIPYLVNQYLDRRTFQQIDSSLIKTGLTFSNDNNRTMIDISFNDIGYRNPEKGLNLIGNKTKMKDLITSIRNHFNTLDHQLPLVSEGISVVIHYQIENQRTGEVLSSSQEKIRINRTNTFMMVNQNDLEDNAIITNFTDSVVKTVTEFTHGNESMIIRITNLYLFYEYIKPFPAKPAVSEIHIPNFKDLEYFYGCESEIYRLHHQLQSRRFLNAGNADENSVVPPQWSFFNRFYHYDEEIKSMVLHNEEIYDKRNMLVSIPAGILSINRTFEVVRGHRLVFKISIWKNDIIVATDSSEIADALKIPRNYKPNKKQLTPADYEQNIAINQIAQAVQDVTKLIKKLHPETSDNPPSITPLPEKPEKTSEEQLAELQLVIRELQEKMKTLEEENAALKKKVENPAGPSSPSISSPPSTEHDTSGVESVVGSPGALVTEPPTTGLTSDSNEVLTTSSHNEEE